MNGFNNKIFYILLIINTVLIISLFQNNEVIQTSKKIVVKTPITPIAPIEEIQKLRSPNSSIKIPYHLNYDKIISQIKQWEKESPDFVEIGIYGKTKMDNDLYYMRICNKLEKKDRPKVMITGCIHGDEPISTACIMACAGSLLYEYNSDKTVKDLIESRDIYIIPVISPDSYLKSRSVDNVDPNRDFPGPHQPTHTSSQSIDAIQNFYKKIKPNAVMSGHSFGRIILMPLGDSKSKCANENDYQKIVEKMSKLCNYKINKICNFYKKPIYGTETDWFHRNGAFSIIMEFGTNKKNPSKNEVDIEISKTWESIKYFIKEAPLIKITAEQDFDFSGNKGISDKFLPLRSEELAQFYYQ